MRTRGDHTGTETIAKDLAEELTKTHTKTTGTNAKDLAYAKITGTIAKDLAEDGENKDHTGTDAKVQTKTHTWNLNKDLAEDGENRDHKGTETNAKDLAKVLAKTHTKTTGTIGKDHAYAKITGTIAKDLAEDGENKDHAGTETITRDLTEVLAKAHTGKLTKDLTRKHITKNEAATNSDGKVETGKGATLRLSKSRP